MWWKKSNTVNEKPSNHNFCHVMKLLRAVGGVEWLFSALRAFSLIKSHHVKHPRTDINIHEMPRGSSEINSRSRKVESESRLGKKRRCEDGIELKSA
jgi:hypothetical protein